MRVYLAGARHLEHSIPPELAAHVEAQLVAARAADPGRSQDDFHRWLTLVRLVCVSFGEPCLTLPRWEHMRALEATREERLRVC